MSYQRQYNEICKKINKNHKHRKYVIAGKEKKYPVARGPGIKRGVTQYAYRTQRPSKEIPLSELEKFISNHSH